ncbi:MAG: hypothetical protein RL141_879 [Candidatus Parcubacteria bacterium]|jgi:F-type H+-transporting ATPase subunit gamma
MAISPKLIKRRIRSVGNTRKITKAMEMVAASKMRKSVQLTLNSRAYARTATELVDRMLRYTDPEMHAFLLGRGEKMPAKPRTLVLVAASDRGLCGGFNAQVLKKTLAFLRERAGESLSVVAVGRRAQHAVRRAGAEIVASFDAISNAPSYQAAMPVGKFAVQQFTQGHCDRLFIAYTDYQSALVQTPIVEQLLPIVATGLTDTLGGSHGHHHDVFEPSPDVVLNQLLPRVIETRIYQALLESSASEHAARMMAMRSATDNASSMLDDLTFTYNQARQAGITREISEISAGKAALDIA